MAQELISRDLQKRKAVNASLSLTANDVIEFLDPNQLTNVNEQTVGFIMDIAISASKKT